MSEALRASSKGLRQVGYFDCPGGGQVVEGVFEASKELQAREAQKSAQGPSR